MCDTCGCKGAEGFDAEMIIDTDKYEGHHKDDRIWYEYSMGITSDYTDGRGQADQADANLVADAPKILNAYKRLLAENRRLYERMNLAEEYIINPERWVSYSFEVLNKNLGENEEYMMDGLKTGHKFSYRDEMGAEGFDAEGFGRWKNRMKKEATQRKFIEMTKNAILRLKVLESVLNKHNLERALNEKSIVELEDALKEINEITMWLIKNNGSFYTAGKKFGFFDAETFNADTPDPINPEYIEEAVQNLPKEQYLEFCDYFEINPNDEKELSQFLQKNRNDSNVLMKLDVLNLDAWYDSRYRLPQASFFGFNAEGFEAEQVGGFLVGNQAVMVHLTGLNSIPVGFDEVEEKEIRKLDEESQKELMSRIMKRAKQRRSKRGRESAEQMMKIIKDNDFTFIAYYGFDAEGFEAEDEEDWEYHVYVSDSPTDDIFIVHDARDFGTQEEAIKAAHEVSKDKRGKGKMVYVVAEEREMDIEQVIYRIDEEGDVLNAESFDAENLSFKERVEKMIDVASPKFEGIKGFGKRIGAKQGKKLDYKIQGVLPRAKGVSSYRRNIETPKWYKGIQLGLMTGLAGFITYKLATDNSKEE